MKRKLTKRNYLGEGYIHQFRNNATGEIVYIPCTKTEYERLAGKDGAKFNPTLEGHTWVTSIGGTLKVDTPNTMLGEDEYCVKGGKVLAILKGTLPEESFQELPLDAVDPTDFLDEKKITRKIWL